MAVVALTTAMASGVNYTHTTANSGDWGSISNSTYFYDLATKIVYFKDANGSIQDVFKQKVSTQSVVSSATVTATSNDDLVDITAQAEALTIANPTGTYTNGQSFLIRVYDDGTARAITYGAKFRTLGDTLPATTVVGEWTYLGVTYNSADDKFDTVANSGNTTGDQPCEIQVACSDETTVLTTGTAKTTFRMPYAMTVTEVRASLTTAGSTSGTTTIDINEGGVSILSTLLTIDFGDKTSVGATTPAVISDSALADDAEITIDIDAISGGASETGLKITLIGTRA